MLDADDHSFVAALIAPLDWDAAAGVDLRRDTSPSSLYFRLRDARSQGRAAERAAEYEPEVVDGGGQAWSEVGKLASEALAHRSKDLEIASWLTESLVRSDGLRGLAAGARVLAGLVGGFWDTGLHPQPDEDDFEGRLAAVAGLSGGDSNGTLLQPLRKIALFERGDGTPLTVWQFEQAEDLAGLAHAGKQGLRRAAEVPALAEIEGEAQAGGRASLAEVGQQAEAALGDWQDLEAALDKVAGRDTPPMRRVSDLLQKILRISLRYAPRLELPAVVQPDETLPVGPANQAAAVAHAPSEHPDREALLQEISRIAALFRLREPNSPLSYTLDNAVRRARLAWPELLREMLPEMAPRAAVLSGLGIEPPSD
jgi:type VI secretion system protein ImpA